MKKLKPKKKKFQAWVKEHKVAVISAGSFILLGLIGFLIGFEIKDNGHFIRNFLASPDAVTLIIVLLVGLFLLGIFVISMIYMRRGDE